MNTLRRCLTGNALTSRLLQEKRTVTCVRFIYNDQFLGMDKYKEARQRTISRLGNMKENFYARMTDQLNSSGPSLIFTEDLKTVIHTCEDNPTEIDVCIRMMKRFHKQNKELRFGTFIFGPVAMRLFYHLQKQNTMQELLADPELVGFFDQLKSYYLTMDLYFKNGMYEEILKTFDELQSKKLAETKYPREAVVLATGACYKINSEETFRMATELITQAREARVTVLRKALAFVVALSINQNKHNFGFEILSSIDRFNNITGTNLKLLALAGLGRLDDAFDVLRRVTDQDSPNQSRIRASVCQSTLDVLQEAVDKRSDKESSHIFEQLCRSLKESNSVSSQTVDELVCLPIEPRAFLREGDDTSLFRQRNRFPEPTFRDSRERLFGGGDRFGGGGDRFGGGGDRFNGGDRFGRANRDDDFQPRRRHFAGLADEF